MVVDERYVDAFSGLILLENDRARGRRLLAALQTGERHWESFDDEEWRLASGIALIDLARERSLLLRYEDPANMVELAEAGRILADSLAIDPYGDRVVRDVRARAWAELGNAYRVADDLQRAEEALTQAQDLAVDGTGLPDVLLPILEHQARLLADRRRFDEAAELLEAIEAVYARRSRAANDRARVLVGLANVRSKAYEPEHATLVFLRALRYMDPASPDHLAAVHGLALSLAESGSYEAALEVVKTSRRLYRRAGKLNGLRLIWLEGKIAAGLGQPGQAEAKLHTARLAFLREGKPGDSALVSLDLALLLARQERRQELALLVAQMLKTFKALGIAREAIASLVLLKKSCEEQLSVDRLCGQIEALARIMPELEASARRSAPVR